MAGAEIERLIALLAKLPGLGPRSARRAALRLIARRETLLEPLARALREAAESVRPCSVCGNYDSTDPCAICADPKRDRGLVCVVEGVADLWALERAGAHRGTYQVLGGVLSALGGVGPEDLAIAPLLRRVQAAAAAPGGEVAGAPGAAPVREVILALSATVDGQTTAHYLAERLKPLGVAVSRLAHGVPVGGELDHLDDGTILAALRARRPA